MPLTKEELDEFTEDFIADETDDETVVSSEKPDNSEVNKDGTDDSPDKNEDETPGVSDGSTLWDDASEEQRTEVSSLQSRLATVEQERDTFRHAADSDRGRHKALHAKAEDLQRENAALKAKVEVSDDADSDDDNEYSDDELNDLQKDLPEVTALINRQNRDLKNQMADLQKNQPAPAASQNEDDNSDDVVSPQQSQDNKVAHNQELDRVKAAHPDFEDIRRDPSYATWLNRVAPGVKQMASSGLAADAIQLIDMFKASRGPVDDKQDDMDALVDIPKKGGIKSNLEDSDDFDAAFEHFGEKIAAERAAH